MLGYFPVSDIDFFSDYWISFHYK